MSTTRLKKAIENSDGSGFGNLLESFVTYGTALPSLADKKDSNAFVPLWEQEVRDEQGRKRLHGAFTGGWSAGHFNTVGSKEGWTPSTFKSSRAVRSVAGGKSTSEAAEAFMDAEDLADLAEARTLQTSVAYSAPPPAYDPLLGNLGTTISNSTVEATAALASLIQPSSSRIGAKLMRKMGWRDGQGVGPRITMEQRKKQAFELGIKIDEAEMYEGLDEASKHYYAPLDRPLASLKEVGVSTDKGWGLGYKCGPTVAALSRGGSTSTEQSTARATAYDDDDEEDEVYSKPSAMTTLDSREKKKWGIVDLDDENDNYRISGSSSRKAQTTLSRSKNYGQSFHDGTSILVGFSLNEERTPIPSTSQLPMPPPRDWKPNPQKIWDEAENSNGKGKGKQLDADERGNLLGEPQPAPLPISVFEYLSSKSKERLANLTNPGTSSNSTTISHSASSSNSVPLGNSRMGSTSIPIPEPEPDVPLLIPQLDGPTALAALKGFQPFSTSSTSPDAMRQARYTLYLQFQAHLLPPSNATLPFGPRKFPNGTIQTISELNKELDDYVKAARVFKPVTGMLAGRFTSGGSGVILPPTAAVPGFYQPAPKPAIMLNEDGTLPSDTNHSEPERLTPAQQAVRNNMFGTETRIVENWRPARLICKRFGVVVPYTADVEAKGEEEEVVAGGAWKEAGSGRGDWGKRTGAGEVLGKASMDILMQSSGFRKLQPPPEEDLESNARNGSNDQQRQQAESTSTTKPVTIRSVDAPSIANVGLGDDESQGAETLTYTKAPKDIFAAIFADSDDDDEEYSDDEEEVKSVAPVKPTASKPLPIEAPLSKLISTPVDSSSDSLPLSGAKALADSLEESNATLDSISISTYRPNFVPTAARTTKDPSKEEKKKSKKRKAKATLSFDVEDGDEVEVIERPIKKDPKKRKVEEKKVEVVEEGENGEDVWQEVKSIVHPSIVAATGNNLEAGKRIRASDLY